MIDNSEAWAVIVGILMPLVISWLKDVSWPDRAKFYFSVGLCIVAGGLTSLFAGQLVFSWQNAVVDIAIVFLAAQVFYKGWFEGTGWERRLAGEP